MSNTNEPITAPKNTETTLYNHAEVQITSLRAVFGAKTYAISNITSVEGQKIEPSGCFPISLAILGGALTLFGALAAFADGGFGMLMFGLLLLIPGVAIYRSAKPSFAVNITTSAGEVKAYTSNDWETIRQIVEALNNAIVQKG